MDNLESIDITNPTEDDFTWRYNGIPYTVKAGETKAFARPVAYHLAKHLAIKMITEEASKKVTVKDRENPHAAVHVKISQLSTYDTPELRVALFQVLGNGDAVLDVVKRYPFKGFIGEMSLYENFVTKSAGKKETEVTPA